MLFSGNLFGIEVRGIVKSASTNQPLQGVNVIADNDVMNHSVTDKNGRYTIEVAAQGELIFKFAGMQTKKIPINGRSVINVKMIPLKTVTELEIVEDTEMDNASPTISFSREKKAMNMAAVGGNSIQNYRVAQEPFNREGYATIHENGFKKAMETPLSTFSIDVDAASYSNMRRFLNNGSKPPIDAVRIEEMINYFNYEYPQPKDEHPFAIYKELHQCPWNEDNMLLHVGIQGKKIAMDNLPPSNIVFLLDVSGSMSSPNKLPLLKKAFKLLINQLDEKDRVAIVVYAGSSGLVLPGTTCDNKQKILESLNNLRAGGSTAGAAGLKLAYKVAGENFIRRGNNRIILATDGDFNVGVSSNAEMERLIEKKREKGIFISVLGFGMGNYQDSKMEIIADKGNGNYAYIDNILEAKKVLVNEFGGTLFTIAKDVKIQIEFNPAQVKSYRLIGYENRLLNKEDFADDKKDAGELGSGHTVTALYEIVPNTRNSDFENTLKYQTSTVNEHARKGNEIATVKFRYKKPDGDKSILITETVKSGYNKFMMPSENFSFSAAVAGFGMMLRNSEHKGNLKWNNLIKMAQQAKGKDPNGYRSEMIQLMKLAMHL